MLKAKQGISSDLFCVTEVCDWSKKGALIYNNSGANLKIYSNLVINRD